jgi:ABC-type hemin transport system ATPase subunit
LQCFSTMVELAREGTLCIAVTHDLNLALSHCSRVLVLDHGKATADFDAAGDTTEARWLAALSPRLRMGRTPEGRPWVLY